VDTDWITGKQQLILKEHTRLVFRGGPNSEHRSHHYAAGQGKKVVFMRQKKASWHGCGGALKPSRKGNLHDSAAGQRPSPRWTIPASTVSISPATEKNGRRGLGNRGHWCILTGRVGDDPVTDRHPRINPESRIPTYWHARGYGRFAAKPLAPTLYHRKEPPMNLSWPQRNRHLPLPRLILSEIATADTQSLNTKTLSPATVDAEAQKAHRRQRR